MKNTIKVLGIIAIVAVIGFSMTGCKGEADGVLELSGTITVSFPAAILFSYSGSVPCKFTTNLPAPNDSFTDGRLVGNLTEGQTVTWTAKVDSGNISAEVGVNSVYIKNDK